MKPQPKTPIAGSAADVRGYEAIKALTSAKNGVFLRHVLAEAEDNDPFFSGAPAHRDAAQWFLEIWQRFGFNRGVHLRAVHYRIVVEANVAMRDGEPYLNTNECWKKLQGASKQARYQGLVRADAFVDQRSPDPILLATYREFEPEPSFEILEPEWSLPSITINLETSLAMPQTYVSDYDYALADQRYHIVLVIEKSTMDDILLPICRRYGIDLITGAGFTSITTAVNLLKRIQGKPVRGFFISDYDPAGTHMPVALARQIEFWRREYAPNSEIKLTHLGLTKAQVVEYRLPRTPIKDGDQRKRTFEDRHGEGAVELDALEGLRPGELARLVEEAIAPYFDDELEDRLTEAGWEAGRDAAAAWRDEASDIEVELEAIGAEASKIVKQFQPRAKALTIAFDTAMKPLRERLDLSRQAVAKRVAIFEPDLPERPEPAESDADESEWLFDSERGYIEQIEHYHRHKNGGSQKGENTK